MKTCSPIVLVLISIGFLSAGQLSAQPIGMVANDATDTVTAFDDSTGTVLGSVPVPSGIVGDCSITSNGATGFVTNFNGLVTVIDLTGPVPVLAPGPNPIPISNNGEDTTISPDGQFLLVCDGSTPQPVSVVDIATQTEISTFFLGTDCNSVDMCSDGSVLVTSAGAGVVRRLTLDAAGNLLDTGDVLPLGGSPPNNALCGPAATSGVAITRGASQIVSFSIPGLVPVSVTLPSGAFGISLAMDAAGSTLFARSNSTGSVDAFGYSDATGTIGAPLYAAIPILNTPTYFGMDQMALNNANSKLYVSQPGSVDIFDPATGGFLGSITDPSISTATGVCFPTIYELEVPIDIKFCSDPNAFNCKKMGVLPVTIFGTDTVAVSDIDIGSLRLCLEDGVTCTGAPVDWSVDDRGDPTTDLGAEQCALEDSDGDGILEEQDYLNPDGFDDLDAAFDANEVKAVLGDFCDLEKGSVSDALIVIGTTVNGVPIASVPIPYVGVDQLLKVNK